MKIRVQSDSFDLGTEVDAMRAGRTDIGAIASFVGLARDLNEGSGVAAMTLEHYPGMTENYLQRISRTAADRWALLHDLAKAAKEIERAIHHVGRADCDEEEGR